MTIKIEVEIDQWVCNELERMRVMLKTSDFSGLAASVERTQLHVNNMESALERDWRLKNFVKEQNGKLDRSNKTKVDKFVKELFGIYNKKED